MSVIFLSSKAADICMLGFGKIYSSCLTKCLPWAKLIINGNFRVYYLAWCYVVLFFFFFFSCKCTFIHLIHPPFRYHERHWHQNWTTLLSQQPHGLMIFLYGCRQRHLVAAGSSQMVLIVHQMTRLGPQSYFLSCQCSTLLLTVAPRPTTWDFLQVPTVYFDLMLHIILLKWP